MEVVKKIFVSLGYIIIAAILFFYEIYNSYYQEVRSSESYRYGKTISSYYSSNSRYPSNIEKKL